MPLDYPVVERVLDNGLRVVLSPDRNVPAVTVNLWVDVGSRHEVPGRTGFAHLFEHLMFQGSRNVASGEHFSLLMAHGGRLNATTWFDRTNYFETVPTGALDLALWLEADRHGFLLDAVTQENLDNQRDVVKEEKRERYDNLPYGNAMTHLYAAVFPPGHPYSHPTIGSMEDLDAASLEDVHAFFRRHYGPGNSVLTLVGDIDPEEGLAAVERHFGALPAASPGVAVATPPLGPLTSVVHDRHVEDLPADRVYLGFRLPPDDTPEFFAAALALDAIAGLSTSRLFTRLVRRDQAATHVSAHTIGLVDGVSLGFVLAEVADGQDAGAVEQVACEELQRFAEQGPTEVELESSFAQSERAWLSSLASQEERADHLSHRALLQGDPQRVNTYLDRLAAVTGDEVRAAAARWLAPQARAVVSYLKRHRDGVAA